MSQGPAPGRVARDPGRSRLALAICAAVAILAMLVLAGGALVPFLIGAALTYVLAGPVDFLSRRAPRTLSLVVVLAAFVLVLALLVRLLGPALVAQVSTLVGAVPDLLATAERQLEQAGLWWTNLPLPPEVRAGIEAGLADAGAALARFTSERAVAAAGGLLQAAGFLLGLAVVPFFVFYTLRDSPAIPAYVERWAGPRREDARAVLRVADRVLGRWVRAQAVLMLTVGVAVAIGTYLLGQVVSPRLASFALALGLVAGITELFPVIGPVVGAIPAVLIALADEPGSVVWLVLLYVAIQQLENAILVPLIVGDALALHPAVLIVALVVGAALFGLPGAILAAPLLAFARSLYRYTDARLAGLPPGDALARADPARDTERAPSRRR